MKTKVKELRTAAKMTQQQLADLVHVSSRPVKAKDQSGQNSGTKLLSGSVRVDGYNRHLDILYEARILLSA